METLPLAIETTTPKHEHADLLKKVVKHRIESVINAIHSRFKFDFGLVELEDCKTLSSIATDGFATWSTAELETYRQLQLSGPTEAAQQAFLQTELAAKKAKIDSTMLPVINRIVEDLENYLTF